MSTATSVLLGAPRDPLGAGQLRSPGLRLVPQRRSRAAKAPFVVLVVVLLAAGLLGLLLLNTVLAQNAFRLHDLATTSRAQDTAEQELSATVQSLQAPQDLAARARALGMVPAGAPLFLRLPDGAVLGAPGAAPPAAAGGPAVTAPAVGSARTTAVATSPTPASTPAAGAMGTGRTGGTGTRTGGTATRTTRTRASGAPGHGPARSTARSARSTTRTAASAR